MCVAELRVQAAHDAHVAPPHEHKIQHHIGDEQRELEALHDEKGPPKLIDVDDLVDHNEYQRQGLEAEVADLDLPLGLHLFGIGIFEGVVQMLDIDVLDQVMAQRLVLQPWQLARQQHEGRKEA